MEGFSYKEEEKESCKVGVADIDVHVSSHLKEELAWAVDKQPWIISTIK